MKRPRAKLRRLLLTAATPVLVGAWVVAGCSFHLFFLTPRIRVCLSQWELQVGYADTAVAWDGIMREYGVPGVVRWLDWGNVGAMLGMNLGLLALPVIAATVWAWWPRDRTPPGACNSCGYDLKGSPGGPCPECGFALVAKP